jgi:hypothetical protein
VFALPLLFRQWCVAGGEGVAAVVAGDVEDEVVDVTGDECDVAALATAREPPKPTPSAPAPTAVGRTCGPPGSGQDADVAGDAR